MRLNFNKNYLLKLLLIIIIILVLVMYFYLEKNMPRHLVINEIAFNQADSIDWIEIYNPTLNNLSLEGMYLSDKADNLSKFKINGQIIVPSHGFVLIYGDGYIGDLNNSIVANFRVANGETVYLAGKDGSSVIDSLTAIKDENNTAYVTTGRFPDGSDDIFIMSQATPGSANKKDMIQRQLNYREYE